MNVFERAVRDQLALVRETLVARHGWTDFVFRTSIDATRRTIFVSCRSRLATAIRAALRRRLEVFDPRWHVRIDVATLLPRGMVTSDRALLALWRECPATSATSSVATEWRCQDEPLSLLAQHRGWSLVRAADGTIGWTNDVHAWNGGAIRERRRRSLTEVLHEYLAVPYRLGGASAAGIDCSGLVQRVVREVHGTWIPRHTSDQLARFRKVSIKARRLYDGDVVYSGDGRGRLHVGVFAAGCITHASSTQHRVVAENAEAYLAIAGATHVVRWQAILEASRA